MGSLYAITVSFQLLNSLLYRPLSYSRLLHNAMLTFSFQGFPGFVKHFVHAFIIDGGHYLC
jgi:hypothetical protein